MRISDWSSDVCSSDLREIDAADPPPEHQPGEGRRDQPRQQEDADDRHEAAFEHAPPPGQFGDTAPHHEIGQFAVAKPVELEVHRQGIAAQAEEDALTEAEDSPFAPEQRSEEHTSELQSLMRTP